MNSNKTYQMIQLGLLLVILIGLGSVMISWATGHNPFSNNLLKGVPFNGPLEKVKEETCALEAIEILELDVNLADVEVNVGEGSDLKVVESTNDKEKRDLFEISQSAGRILVKRPNSHYFGIEPQHKIEIWLPSSYRSALMITTSSGDINLNGVLELEKLETTQSSGNLVGREAIKAKEVQLTTSSGDKRLEGIETDTYEVTSSSGTTIIKSLKGKGSCMASSGEIEINSLIGEAHEIYTSSGQITIGEIEGELEMEASSGDLKLGTVIGESWRLRTTSGEIIMKALEGKGNCESSSGDIEIEELRLTGDAQFTATSGKIEMGLKTSNTTIRANTSSGDIKGSIVWNYEDKRETEANAQLGNGAEYKLELKTSSGSIRVDEK
ncbi:DUF4097 family beta strand repeat-containing protein [Cellulosilyticum lentocellum]|uniref:DUF4097 domain-containing protein n=1 Tax=Cellulosilyticum lentocellum (strain ATCC 49066 / DSM 5427 / NCIMB 11756 / RHM5) TaxID=642492 RepID=F2JGM9_CELLD|nr:DUF4097 family beta strand repeat-containing protein [Cellulosilyticum lentocellum]ADZ82984.1 hypothetical protein Clole_1257 [Cellulosilyticum lentocellum DSM 5427]